VIRVQNLTKRYDGTVAVDDISFEVERGEVVGFLGPNGAGKTTTMKIITCYMPPTSGDVTIDDRSVLSDSLPIRRSLGYLPEDSPLYTFMPVLEYLEFVAEMRGLKPGPKGRRIKEMIEVCGLGEVLGKDVSALSRGYRQRVGLAQALIHDPDLIILDEPTSGLDPNQIAEIRSMIREFGQEKTLILSTHILPEVTATCDRVIIINRGPDRRRRSSRRTRGAPAGPPEGTGRFRVRRSRFRRCGRGLQQGGGRHRGRGRRT